MGCHVRTVVGDKAYGQHYPESTLRFRRTDFLCFTRIFMYLSPKAIGRKALSQSDAVFVGRVIAWHNASIEFAPGHSSPGYTFVFEVERLYKGALSSEVAVLTGHGRGDCGCPFKVGEKYLVYAYGKKGLETNVCTRTTNINGADADLAELGVPKTVFVHATRFSWSTGIAIILLAFLTGIVVGRKWLLRKGRGEALGTILR